MHYTFFIANRYLKTKKRSALVSRITSIAIGGVLVGVATLVIVLSVINGFETELRERIVGFNTNVVVFSRHPAAWAGMDSVATKLERVDEVVASAPFVRSEALATYDIVPGRRKKLRGVVVKGVDLERESHVSAVIDSIRPPMDSFDTSYFEDDPPMVGVVLGLDLAVELRIGIGEKLTLITAPSTATTSDVDAKMQDCRRGGFLQQRYV